MEPAGSFLPTPLGASFDIDLTCQLYLRCVAGSVEVSNADRLTWALCHIDWTQDLSVGMVHGRELLA